MPLTIFHGPHPLGGLRTVACPSWDGTACRCDKAADGSVPEHLEHHWPAEQDTAVSLREARLLAAEHFGRVKPPTHGDLKGLLNT
jgi:hypothetical protein